MVKAKATEKLTGITISGDFNDFYEIVESIYRMTGLEEDYGDRFWSVKNRLLGMCYDIRHAYMGDREIELVENGVCDDIIRYHSMIMPKTAVYYSANFLFPEAVFVALSISELCESSLYLYGEKCKKIEGDDHIQYKFTDYIKDKAILGTLSAVILGALGHVIGDAELEKLIQFKHRQYGYIFAEYATQYVDKCNIDYLKTPLDKRKDKIKNITKRILQKPDAYKNMKRDLEYSAKVHNCSFHELHDPRIVYPENVEW